MLRIRRCTECGWLSYGPPRRQGICRRCWIDNSILRAIGRLQEPYGVSIRRFVMDDIGVDLSFGGLVVRLDRLEANGAISSRYETGGPERGYRHKRVFALV